MRKSLIVLLLVVGALGIILFLFRPANQEAAMGPKKGAGPGGAPPMAVQALVAKAEAMRNRVTVPGTILPNESVELRSEIAGKIIEIQFNEGESVKQGQALFRIDDRELSAQADQAKANLQLLESAESRRKALLNQGGISSEDYERAAGELAMAQAQTKLLEARLAKTVIRAPFSGLVGLRQVSEGSFVDASKLLARLQSTDRVKIDFSLPEAYASQVAIGDSVTVRVRYSKVAFPAKVLASDRRIDPQSNTLPVRAICDNKNHQLIPGGFAEVEVYLGSAASSILLPANAINSDNRGTYVFLAKNGKAIPAYVSTGLRNETQVEILSGVLAGDTVITSGLMQLRPEASIKVTLGS